MDDHDGAPGTPAEDEGGEAARPADGVWIVGARTAAQTLAEQQGAEPSSAEVAEGAPGTAASGVDAPTTGRASAGVPDGGAGGESAAEAAGSGVEGPADAAGYGVEGAAETAGYGVEGPAEAAGASGDGAAEGEARALGGANAPTGQAVTVGPGPEGEAADTAAPVATVPDLPPWTDPPTGQVPAVLDRTEHAGEDPLVAAVGSGPSWREHDHEWDDPTFEPALLADDAPPSGGSLSGADEDDDWLEADWVGRADNDEDAGDRAGGGPDGSSDGGQAVDEGEARRRGRATTGRPAGRTGASSAASRRRGSAPDRADEADRGADGGGGGGRRTGRNVPVAIGTGVVVAAVALGCLAGGSVSSAILAGVVVTLAAAEGFGSLRRAGHRPATLVGLAATVGVLVGTYTHGLGAIAIVSTLTVMVTMLWYLLGLGRGTAVVGMGSTLLVYGWVGVLGSFGTLLVAPSLFPDRHGVAFLFGAIAAVVAADVGALAVGAWLGRHHLAPRVSPHKTWEGAIGGGVLAVVVSIFLVGHVHPWTAGSAAILGVVAAVLAPVGDLCESLVKRELALKDMGSLLPGHGGVLDRFDGLLFVLPATYVLVRLLRIG